MISLFQLLFFCCLQELYTRPPVTKVIDGYTPPHPIKFITPDPSSVPKSETVSIGNLSATTYKPVSPIKQPPPSPTTYHPPAPPIMYNLAPSLPKAAGEFRPITNQPFTYDYGGIANFDLNQTPKPAQRFSSHYNAKNADFLKSASPKRTKGTTTVRPVADVLEGLGIVGQAHSRRRYTINDDYFPSESAPIPVVSSYIPQNLAPKIRPDAYSSFKPLNIGEEIRVKPEVEDYLTRFGIVGGRKRKALKKSEANQLISSEQDVEESEIATAKIPSTKKTNRSAQSGGSELEKLLSNLQELERLNVNPKVLSTTTTKPTSTTTTTTTTTPQPTTTQGLITHGDPMLIEPKKPRRRIDPNLDINFGSTGNQQTEQGSADQLQKLLQNLQELEKLRINPENVLKTVAPAIKSQRVTTQKPALPAVTVALTTAKPQGLANRFSDFFQPQQNLVTKKTNQQNDLEQLQQILQELQAVEKANARTTRPPPVLRNNFQANGGVNDFDQLRKLLSDDRELERLYNQARGKKITTTTTTTTSTTTSTRRPGPTVDDLEQLQKYFAELDRARTTSVTSTTTTSLPTITSSSNIQRPLTPIQDTAQRSINPSLRPKKQSTDNDQLQELINRVQQLERLNSRFEENNSPLITTTEATKQQFAFTSRNVKSPPLQASANDYRIPSNDFAHLQQLYKQVQEVEDSAFGKIEISTAATASKSHSQSSKRTQDFAQRIIDITNDTGSGSSLQEVDPNEFVQLQKLLSKVQELERVKISADGLVQTVTQNPRLKTRGEVTTAASLVTAASVRMTNVQNLNGAQIVYAENEKPKEWESDESQLNLPPYKVTTALPKLSSSLPDPTSSEELRELAFSAPANPKKSPNDKGFEQYKQLLSQLEDSSERNAYRNMQPPMIQKTVTKEPPKFVATRKPQDVPKQNQPSQQQADLEELQKLLNNAQELEKLGVNLPKELSHQIESKLSKPSSLDANFKRLPTTKSTFTNKDPPEVKNYLTKFGILNTETDDAADENLKNEVYSNSPTADSIEVDEKSFVFSLTTAKSLLPKEPKTTTESTVVLPVFSATKIIEAAIKRAATKIGVSTEKPQGFRRRIDDEDNYDTATEADDDLVGEFSQMSYQMAIPEINRRLDANVDVIEDNVELGNDTVKPEEIKTDLKELQRLISNLQELERLNISISSNKLKEADTKYLESFKKSEENDTIKNRRQSVTPSTTTEDAVASTSEVAMTPTRVNLDLNVEEGDSAASSTTTEATTTTEESRNGAIADLEDSFGPETAETPAPPKKKNGFYFLADWNSFLEVGPPGTDEQVVVRFNPKIGDPRLFLPVSVP